MTTDSMDRPSPDLQALALDRQSPLPVRWNWGRLVVRRLIPGLILGGFLLLFVIAAGEQWMPRQAVTVVPVLVAETSLASRAGTVLFQAAGWVEPRPSPVLVTALTSGVVAEMLVVEGMTVEAGQQVAKLVDVDARLELRQAGVTQELRLAEKEMATAELRAARLRLDQPVHLHAALAEAEAALQQTETELAGIPFQLESAAARRAFAEENLRGKEAAGDSIAGRLIQQARNELDALDAALRELRDRQPRLEKQRDALRRRVVALTSQLELRIDEEREVESAAARERAAQARLDEADIAIEQANLAVERTTVKAPCAGRVLTVVARPGTRIPEREGSADGGAAAGTIVTLYDPASLQVRADVRLENVRDVLEGQPVTITSASLPGPVSGHVLQVTSSASIQKNTLEVKVAIDQPSPELRPEMIVSTAFLAPIGESPGPSATMVRNLLVPRELIESGAAGDQVWIVDADNRARRRAVKVEGEADDNFAVVTEGLTPADKLIVDGRTGLADGQRVRITGSKVGD